MIAVTAPDRMSPAETTSTRATMIVAGWPKPSKAAEVGTRPRSTATMSAAKATRSYRNRPQIKRPKTAAKRAKSRIWSVVIAADPNGHGPTVQLLRSRNTPVGDGRADPQKRTGRVESMRRTAIVRLKIRSRRPVPSQRRRPVPRPAQSDTDGTLTVRKTRAVTSTAAIPSPGA